MDPFLYVVIVTAIAGVGGTGLGGLIGVLFTRNSEKLVSLLLSFAGGVMLCIVCLDLMSDALNQAPGEVWNVFLVIGMTAVGFGAIVGYSLGAISPGWLTVSLSFASGAMLYVVFGELLPESILMWRSKAPAFAMLAGLLVGVLILFL